MNTEFNQTIKRNSARNQAGGIAFGTTSGLNAKRPQTKNFVQMNKDAVAGMSRQANATANAGRTVSQFKMAR